MQHMAGGCCYILQDRGGGVGGRNGSESKETHAHQTARKAHCHHAHAHCLSNNQQHPCAAQHHLKAPSYPGQAGSLDQPGHLVRLANPSEQSRHQVLLCSHIAWDVQKTGNPIETFGLKCVLSRIAKLNLEKRNYPKACLHNFSTNWSALPEHGEPAGNKQLLQCLVGRRVWRVERECFVRPQRSWSDYVVACWVARYES